MVIEQIKENECVLRNINGKILWRYSGECENCPNKLCEMNPNGGE